MFQVTTMNLADIKKTPDGKVDYSDDFLWKTGFAYCFRTAGGRTRRYGIGRYIYFWANVPRRKLEHATPLVGVLDD